MNIIVERLRRTADFYHFKGEPPAIEGIIKRFPFESEGESYDGYLYTEKPLSEEVMKKYDLVEELGQGWVDRITAEDDYDEANGISFVNDVEETIEKDGYAVFTSGGDDGVVYAPSARGGYQATKFDSRGWVGHESGDTVEAVVERFNRVYGGMYEKPMDKTTFESIAKEWEK